MKTVSPRAAAIHLPLGAALLMSAFALLTPSTAEAHCDTLDGPVVNTARTALETKKVEPVVAWVQPGHEREIRHAFSTALAERQRSPGSREKSDLAFFETLVRVHRAGEGAPYTGLKPAGTDPGLAVRTADLAMKRGDAAVLEKLMTEKVRTGVRERFAKLEKLPPPAQDVAAGRAWVQAYVDYVHFVERVDATASGAGVHGHEGAEAEAAEHDHSGHANAEAPGHEASTSRSTSASSSEASSQDVVQQVWTMP